MASVLQAEYESVALFVALPHTMVSFVSNFMVAPLITVLYLGRGRQASTKPNVITRSDLLRGAEMAEASPVMRSSYSSESSSSSRDSGRKRRRSKKSDAT